MVSKAIGLREEPELCIALNKSFRPRRPGLADFFRLAKQMDWAAPRVGSERFLFLLVT
jgi:hypothetical protein